MALKAGRRGIAKRLVDAFGNYKGSSPTSEYYTKSESDDKFELKADIGGLQFRNNEGQAQYKIPNGEWANFNSGDTKVGFNIPESLIETEGINTEGFATILEGGYYNDTVNHILYVDITIQPNTSNGFHIYIPTGEYSYGASGEVMGQECIEHVNPMKVATNSAGSGSQKSLHNYCTGNGAGRKYRLFGIFALS